MEDRKFKIGDVVALISEDPPTPPMTVDEFDRDRGVGESRYICRWFHAGELKTGNFSEESLRLLRGQ